MKSEGRAKMLAMPKIALTLAVVALTGACGVSHAAPRPNLSPTPTVTPHPCPTFPNGTCVPRIFIPL